jgi:glycosyltransferase involved in cell wall biosynthesis
MPLVSVILPTHNRPQSVVRAAASVLDQSFRELELIVVDDGSAVPAEQALSQINDGRMRILRSDMPLGPARARNLGLEVATGGWIAFQDDDDEWLAGKVEQQAAVADRSDDAVGVVYCPFWTEFRDGRRAIGGRRAERLSGDLHLELLRGNFVALPAVLVRREAIEQVGRFDPALPCFEDWELFIRLAARFRFERISEPLVVAHDTPQSINKSSSTLRAAALERILEKHADAIELDPQVHADFLFHIAHHRCLGGDFERGQKLFGQSFRVQRSWRTAMARAAASLGPGAYHALANGYDKLRSKD